MYEVHAPVQPGDHHMLPSYKNDDPGMYVERAPPLRIVAVVTMLCSTLDLFADFLMCHELARLLSSFYSSTAVAASYGYFVFTALSVLVYTFEMVDVCLTLKNDEENKFFARLAKSLVLALEEVPLPALLYVIWQSEPRLSLAQPFVIVSWIKLIALVWGIVKFAKLTFCWPFLPITQSHGTQENFRRCFTFTKYRVAMIIVNVAHVIAILLVVNNIVMSSKGGKVILPPERQAEQAE